MDLATLILSGAALAISGLALYVASLRRANIVVNPVEDLSAPAALTALTLSPVIN